jgi:hypothetical protein
MTPNSTAAQLVHGVPGGGTTIGIASIVQDVASQLQAKSPAGSGRTLGVCIGRVAMSDAGRTRATAWQIYAVSRSFAFRNKGSAVRRCTRKGDFSRKPSLTLSDFHFSEFRRG